MSETIKAKTIQRLSSKRRLSCPLRASLSPVRSTIFPLLILLLAVLADASYPSVLPPKPLYAPIVEKKIKKKALYGITTLLLPPPRPPVRSRAHGTPSVGPLFRALVAPQGAPLMRRLRTASSLMPTAPYAEFSYVSTTRSIRDRTHV